MEFKRERRTYFWRMIAAFVAMLLVQSSISSPALSEEPSQSVTSYGLTAYFGLMPAAIAEGIVGDSTHGVQPAAAHNHHLIVAIFNSVTGERVTDATVMAKVSQPGFEFPEKPLEPMESPTPLLTATSSIFPGPGFIAFDWMMPDQEARDR